MSWENFTYAVSGRENIPYWEWLWNDCVQEEIQKQTKYGSHVKTEEEENISIAKKEHKAKGKKNLGWVESNLGGKKKKDINKVKCFSCH